MTHSLKRFYPLSIPFLVIIIHCLFVFASGRKALPRNDQSTIKACENDSNNTLEDTTLFGKLKLNSLGLSRAAYLNAVKGYEYLRSKGRLNEHPVLSIVDFSLPSSEKRLFVIDMENCRLLYNTYVAHGRNSGKEYANQFSNSPESFKSSLGFYVTKDTYKGTHGFSLRLEGEEKGINDNALSRAIVMHSADYVNKSLIKSQGYIGRSLGCPALPKDIYKPIIEKIKNGSCLFMYSPSGNYVFKSPVLQNAG